MAPMDTELDVFFYEAFEEEEEALKRLLPPGLRAGFIPRRSRSTATLTPLPPSSASGPSQRSRRSGSPNSRPSLREPRVTTT